MPDRNLVTLRDDTGALAVLAPGRGGWLVRYARPLPRRGLVDALHWSEEAIDRYPKQIYAGMPVLFPLAGKNRAADLDHHYEWNGVVRELPQHGFARRCKWEIVQQAEDHLLMELTDSELTRLQYPFSFRQRLSYRLAAGRLRWEQVIENRSAEPMPFSTGFHPYFQVPLTPASERKTCFVEIPDAKRLTPQGNFEKFTAKAFPGQNWSVEHDVSGTLFLTDLARPELVLVDPASELEVLFNFEDAPRHRFVALWARSAEEPFYCLEPWTALPNPFGRPNDRELIVLEPNQTFRAAMWMELRPMA